MNTAPTGEEDLVLNPNAVPVLSSSAKNMNIEKLLAAPLPTYDSSVPGSFVWTKLAFWMCRRVSSVNFEPSRPPRPPLSRFVGPAQCVAGGTPTV
ncbi:MAG: hypothetical protein CM15mP78_00870 [Candidatus Poseidoniales archaeon]|nr:MAG: hypothetical protein CM15mP78_00870 [Candidatus Poseidoniales archaeon]